MKGKNKSLGIRGPISKGVKKQGSKTNSAIAIPNFQKLKKGNAPKTNPKGLLPALAR